ncbi:MAG TPA: hypothetical protein VGY31_10200 [Terriglobia bacterium]|nr:hypothetical protein [Terriglobia bacterium]
MTREWKGTSGFAQITGGTGWGSWKVAVPSGRSNIWKSGATLFIERFDGLGIES